jgi:hypothetical protein
MRGIRDEGGPATGGAEVVGVALQLVVVRSHRRIDVHAADGVAHQ